MITKCNNFEFFDLKKLIVSSAAEKVMTVSAVRLNMLLYAKLNLRGGVHRAATYSPC